MRKEGYFELEMIVGSEIPLFWCKRTLNTRISMSLAYPGGLNNFNFFTLNQNEEIATHQNSRCFRKTSFNFLREKIIYYETV